MLSVASSQVRVCHEVKTVKSFGFSLLFSFTLLGSADEVIA